MTGLALPTWRDEEWRYADFAALATLAPERFGEWKDVALAPVVADVIGVLIGKIEKKIDLVCRQTFAGQQMAARKYLQRVRV